MASKKYSLLTGFLCLLASFAFSQTGPTGGYDPADSSVVPDKRMPQHTEFLNGTYNFPAKPRNQWEVGAKFGAFNISGDVASQTNTGFGVHVRKAVGYVFSFRLEYMYGNGKGLSWLPSTGYLHPNVSATENPWKRLGYTGPVYYNYKTTVQDLALEGIINLNNIRFHKARTGASIYAILGFGGTVYDTKVNALGDNGQRYTQFANVSGGVWDDRKDTKDELKDFWTIATKLTLKTLVTVGQR